MNCLLCGNSTNHHARRGLCSKCYQQQVAKDNLAAFPKLTEQNRKRNCLNCSLEFVMTHQSQKLCSRECSLQRKQERLRPWKRQYGFVSNQKSEFKRKYNLTLECVATMQKQMLECGICKRLFSEEVKRRIDHAHDSSQLVRGLLCNGCNSKLGWYENKRAAINQYLMNPPAQQLSCVQGGFIDSTPRSRRRMEESDEHNNSAEQGSAN